MIAKWAVSVAGLVALAGLVWLGLGAPWPGAR